MNTDLTSLNPQQMDAVLKSIDKNVVLLAGAGSGKTSTMIKRTEYLLRDMGVNPEQIMVVTFTNKAASEIRERMSAVTDEYYKMWTGTFHSICVRMLRKFGDAIGITNFSIMDQKAAKKLMSSVLYTLGMDSSSESVKTMLGKVSHLKNEVIRPKNAVSMGVDEATASVFAEYQKRMWQSKTFDFDNLIIYGIALLGVPSVREWFRNNIKYVMVDEMQDSNKAQFMLVNEIVQDNNIMMVGDLCQSIYGFRNARPELLNDYINVHPNTILLKLEQNYRSTKNIINAANKVVNNNDFGIKLEMFCDNEQGELIQHHASPDPSGEAKWITSEIMVNRQLMGKNYSDYAIIYRANYQSREIEDCLTREGIPYVVFGATSFYARKETRDLLAYCKMITNPLDKEAFGRVLNTLSGVGKQTVEKIMSINNNSYDALRQFVSNPPPKSTAKSIMSLESVLNVMSASYNKCSEIVDAVIANTDYRAKYSNSNNDDALESVEIIDEFSDMVKAMEKESPDEGILEIIDKISLLSDAKGAEKEKQDAVKLMTAHASKGLEFDTVYVIGCEEGSFPHINSIESSNPKDSIEEERRLFYVAMTRAKEKLYITNSLSKFKKGVGTVKLKPSRFISEIPDELLEEAI